MKAKLMDSAKKAADAEKKAPAGGDEAAAAELRGPTTRLTGTRLTGVQGSWDLFPCLWRLVPDLSLVVGHVPHSSRTATPPHTHVVSDFTAKLARQAESRGSYRF